jgi:hypothetical protein
LAKPLDTRWSSENPEDSTPFDPLFVLFALDATFDRLPENPQDPLKVLNNITDKQDELIKKAIDILEKVRLEVRNEPATDAQDIPCRSEIEAL